MEILEKSVGDIIHVVFPFLFSIKIPLCPAATINTWHSPVQNHLQVRYLD